MIHQNPKQKSNPKPLTIQMYLVDDFGAKKKKRRLRLDDDYLTNNFNTETNSLYPETIMDIYQIPKQQIIITIMDQILLII